MLIKNILSLFIIRILFLASFRAISGTTVLYLFSFAAKVDNIKVTSSDYVEKGLYRLNKPPQGSNIRSISPTNQTKDPELEPKILSEKTKVYPEQRFLYRIGSGLKENNIFVISQSTSTPTRSPQ